MDAAPIYGRDNETRPPPQAAHLQHPHPGTSCTPTRQSTNDDRETQQILDIEKWGKQDRIRRSLRALSQYGGAAKAVLPQLRQLEKDLKAHREARNLKPIVEQIGQMMKKIEASSGKVELRSL